MVAVYRLRIENAEITHSTVKVPTMPQHSFEQFLTEFVPKVASKSLQTNKAMWILETTGSADAADLKAELETELRLLFNDKNTYQQLLEWDQDESLRDPLLKRQLNVLIRSFKPNIIPKKLLEEISKKETELMLSYATFRPQLDGKALSENAIREILKTNTVPDERKKAWEASKDIGDVLAPAILTIVNLRNETARSAGYNDYFQMQLGLQEVDPEWLFKTLEDLANASDSAYMQTLADIEKAQSHRFGVTVSELGPWAWAEPFCQEDPLDSCDLDQLIKDVDISAAAVSYYKKMGIDITPVLKRSDMYERPGKNQHAFCVSMDRASDVRTLNNVTQSIKWTETVLHEFGHAIYDLGYDSQLPWLLKEHPHVMTTEAMALIAGRQAYLPEFLSKETKPSKEQQSLILKASRSLTRRQLIFSRWVLVVTFFERELYGNPQQDLNALWWRLVEKFQKIHAPIGRERKNDWAAKYHIGLAPVYYYGYLLGEMLASMITETIALETGSEQLGSVAAGNLLKERFFRPGNSMHWMDLVKYTTGESFNSGAWMRQFAKKEGV
ncbi:MAG: M2 family metallopeptidase [Parachlamydiaceae bacterium]|nr:M2 family metallopeptidase [Parachlamydiaceae bacterium]